MCENFMFKNILMVCVGNICRSPMVEGLFVDRLKNIEKINVSSAGLSAVVDRAAVCEAQEIMQNIGIDISSHRARQLTFEMLLQADLVLVMESWHKKEIEKIMPESRGKVYLLGHWRNFEIPDPYRGTVQNFAECLELIEFSWQDWSKRIVG